MPLEHLVRSFYSLLIRFKYTEDGIMITTLLVPQRIPRKNEINNFINKIHNCNKLEYIEINIMACVLSTVTSGSRLRFLWPSILWFLASIDEYFWP